jgi:hypothetical protein
VKNYALATLERILPIARRNGADEVRLISGRYPMFVAGTENKTIEGPELSATMIRDIHQACLALGADELPESGAALAYRFVSKTMGAMRCVYTFHGSARSLSLFPESDASETVDFKGRRKPPALRAEAKPDED